MVVGHLILLATHLWAVKNASGGDPVTSRVLDPQGVEAGTLRFPDRDDVGTGTFESYIPPGALATDPFVRVGAAAPADGPPGEFHITTVTSVSTRRVTVELRRLPRTEPVSGVAAPLPQDFDPMRRSCTRGDFHQVERLGRHDGRRGAESEGRSLIALVFAVAYV
jgi:hypothetical protein